MQYSGELILLCVNGAPTQKWQTLITVSRVMTVWARIGESPAPGGGVRGFQDGRLGREGVGRQAVWEQRMNARYWCDFANSINSAEQGVPITPRHLKDDCDFLATNQLLLHLQAIQVERIVCRQQAHWMSGVINYRKMSEAPFVH